MKGGTRGANGSCISRIFNTGKKSTEATSFCYRERGERLNRLCWGWKLYCLSLSLAHGIGIPYATVAETTS